MKILIDADACPRNVLLACMQLGEEYCVEVWTVANFNHKIRSDRHLMVGCASQEADIKVINLTEPNDIVVTQDWGLAAMVLGKQAYCINPNGMEYRAESIEFMLEEREVKAKLRRGGGKTKGPKKRKMEDDYQFSIGLRKILSKTKINL